MLVGQNIGLDLPSLHNRSLVYLDSEYIRNRSKLGESQLVTIQHAIIHPKELHEKKPSLKVLYRWEYESEKELLGNFYPIWKRINSGMSQDKKLIPIGFQVQTDLELLRSKYNLFFNEKRTSYAVISNTRSIELRAFAIAETGLIDPRLATFLAFLGIEEKNIQGNTVIQLVRQVLKQGKEAETARNQLVNYVKHEYSNNWKIIHHYFGKDYIFAPNSQEGKALQMQEMKTKSIRRQKHKLN